MTFIHYEHPQAPDPVNAADLTTKNYVDLNDRTYFCRVYRAAAFTFPATANQLVNPVLWDTVAAGSGYSAATGMFTVPISGSCWLARASLSIGFTVNAVTTATIYVSGAVHTTMNAQNNSGVQATVVEVVALIGNANAGDTISVGGTANQASVPLRTGFNESYFAVACLGNL